MYLSYLLCVLGWACGEGNDPVADLQDQVIAVHDEVMPKMGEVKKLEKELREKGVALLKGESPDSTQASTFTEQADQLNAAHEGMMDWMRNFSPPGEEMEQADALEYLQSEMKKISTVKEDMLQGLEGAKAMLE